MQQFCNIVEHWTIEGDLVKQYELDLGDKFRNLNIDLADDFTKEMSDQISRTWYFYYDKRNRQNLVCYINDILPDGVNNSRHPDKYSEKYLVISDKYGNRLSNHEIKVSESFIPFDFFDNHIYATEITDNNHLEIVIYKFVKD